MTRQQRLVLIISILASFVSMLDMFIVNVALPSISRDLGGGLVVQQWVVDGYLLTLGALILIAGSLSDLFGRKRVLQYGLIGFGIASVLCAVAPNGVFLVVARILQGIAGALLVPSSLALIISSFSGPSQSKAIGTWTGWGSIAAVIGPLLGGVLLTGFSWRIIFAVNVVPIAVTLILLAKIESPKEPAVRPKVDFWGAVLCAAGLGGVVYGLIEQSHYGWSDVRIYLPVIIGSLLFVLFLGREHHIKYPMLPLGLFTTRNFAIGNLATVAIYAGLSVSAFLITIFLQQVGGYSPLRAGLAMLPVSIIMFFLAPRFGALAGKYGPRFFMAVGPAIAGLGFLSMVRIGGHVQYFSQLLPSIMIFGLGLSMTVAPLTSAVLGAINAKQAGIGSAVNNAIARIAGLLAIAALGVVVGPTMNVAGFHHGVVMMAILLFIGGVISAVGIANPSKSVKTTEKIVL